jgi:hypothetical protein
MEDCSAHASFGTNKFCLFRNSRQGLRKTGGEHNVVETRKDDHYTSTLMSVSFGFQCSDWFHTHFRVELIHVAGTVVNSIEGSLFLLQRPSVCSVLRMTGLRPGQQLHASRRCENLK